MPPFHPNSKKAFTLVELLVVISIIMLMTSLTGPVLQSLGGAGSTNKAVSDLVGTLEHARAYAMANNTYVRVGFYHAGVSASRATSSTAIVSIYSAEGSEATVMSASTWPLLSNPILLDNFALNSSLNGITPDTSSDADPFSATSSFGSLNLRVSNLGSVAVSHFVEFTPSGEARLSAGQSVRYIKICLNRAMGNQSDPFILRLSGMNGDVATLRKENM